MIRSYRNRRSTDTTGMNTSINKLGLFAAANEMRVMGLVEGRSFPLPIVYHRNKSSSTHRIPACCSIASDLPGEIMHLCNSDDFSTDYIESIF